MLNAPNSIYDQLIEKIFSGEISPGSRLIERELAEELGVSRIPVREALAQMVAQGALIGGAKQRSVRVREYTAAEIHQLFEFRELIEGGAARHAATHATAEQLDALESICGEMEAEIGQRRFSPTWANLEHQFHNGIAEAGGNEWFASTLHLLLKQSHYVFYRLRWRTLAECGDEVHWQLKRTTITDHRAILAHLRAEDGEAAEKLMRRHIRQSYEKDHWPERVERGNN